jgi:hypothetical protein
MVTTMTRRPPRSKRRFTAALVGLVLVASVALAALTLHNYHRSEAYLERVASQMRRAGARTTAEGCVERILAWRERCPLSGVLCDNFAPRAMRMCLEAGDRRGYCRSLPPRRGTSRFGYQDCQDKGVTSETRKACASAYRMLDQHCRRLTGRPPQTRTPTRQRAAAPRRAATRGWAATQLRAAKLERAAKPERAAAPSESKP